MNTTYYLLELQAWVSWSAGCVAKEGVNLYVILLILSSFMVTCQVEASLSPSHSLEC